MNSQLILMTLLVASLATMLWLWRRLKQQARMLAAVETVIDRQIAGNADGRAEVDNELERPCSPIEEKMRTLARFHRSLEVERESARTLIAQQNAERADFYARLSHELRTPLNAIIGYSALVLDDCNARGTHAVAEDVRKIRRAGTELSALIDNLLDVGLTKAPSGDTARAPFALNELLAELVNDRRLMNEDCALHLVAASQGQTLFGSRDRLRRVVTSLIDASTRLHGARDIALSTANHNPQLIELRIAFTRSRGGFATARAENDVSIQAARLMTQAIGGRLHFEDEAGQCAWVLDLPIDIHQKGVSVTPMELAPVVDVESARPRALPPSGKTALVIDDDPAAVELLSRWLDRCGYDVISAHDAASGYAMAQQSTPDIVLLDALMPDRTGYEALPALRALPSLANTPIVIVTVDDDRARGLKAGASDFVRKPVSEADLRRMISVYDRDLQGDVLIIEDDDDAAELLSRTVGRLGFTTRRAADGAQGLQAVEDKLPSAILLDLNMPQLNGFDFIEQLTGDDRFATIPLLVVSGQDLTISQHQKLVAAGARFFLKGNAAPSEIARGLREAVS